MFYRRHVVALIRYAARRGLTADEAADVVGETFLNALEGRYRYRPQRDHARVWLLAIATRRANDLHRGRRAEERRNERLASEACVLTQLDRATYDEMLSGRDPELLDALADLPAVQQAAVRARVLEAREYAEIASTLGLSEAATRQHVSRGLNVLRRLRSNR